MTITHVHNQAARPDLDVAHSITIKTCSRLTYGDGVAPYKWMVLGRGSSIAEARESAMTHLRCVRDEAAKKLAELEAAQ